jgi:hypothetical protein
MTHNTETLTLHRVTMLLPAQRFYVAFSLTEESVLSVVDEFALRLIAVCGAVEEGDFIRFFGFESREGTEVLRGLVARDLIVSPDGVLALSDAGRSLFPQGPSESPRLLQIEHRSDLLAFDLLDFRLVQPPTGDSSFAVCNVLDLPETFDASKSPDEVQRAFQAQFGAYARSRSLDRGARLYFVESVTPRRRFQLPVDIDISLRFGAGVSVDLELDSEHDDDSRLRRLVDEWYQAQCLQRADDGEAWSYLRKHFPWTNPSPPTLASLREFLAGNYPADVVPVVGSLSVPSVVDRVCSVVEDHADREDQQHRTASDIAWLPAQSEFWFSSRSSWSAIDALIDASSADNTPRPVLLLREPWPETELFGLKKRFDHIVHIATKVPNNVEILIEPDAWCAVWAWMKLGGDGLPVPVGVVTTQPDVVKRLAVELAVFGP